MYTTRKQETQNNAYTMQTQFRRDAQKHAFTTHLTCRSGKCWQTQSVLEELKYELI